MYPPLNRQYHLFQQLKLHDVKYLPIYQHIVDYMLLHEVDYYYEFRIPIQVHDYL